MAIRSTPIPYLAFIVAAALLAVFANATASALATGEEHRAAPKAPTYTLDDLFSEDPVVRAGAALAVARESTRSGRTVPRRRGSEDNPPSEHIESVPFASHDGDRPAALMAALEDENERTAEFAIVRALVALNDGRALRLLLERPLYFGEDLSPLLPMARRSAASAPLLTALESTVHSNVRRFAATVLREHLSAGVELSAEPIVRTYRRVKVSGLRPELPLVALYLDTAGRDAVNEVLDDLEAGFFEGDTPEVAGCLVKTADRIDSSEEITAMRQVVARRLLALRDGLDDHDAALVTVAAAWADGNVLQPESPAAYLSESSSTRRLAAAFVIARSNDSMESERRDAEEYLRRNLPVAEDPLLYAWAPQLLVEVFGTAAAATFVDALEYRESYQFGVRGLEILGQAAADAVVSRRSGLSPQALRAVVDWERANRLENLRRRLPEQRPGAPNAAP